jgi:putative hydrolase of the HAD superfamily
VTPDTPVETVLFDLDGTLLTYDQDPEAVLEETFERAGVESFCSVTEFWGGSTAVPDVDDDHAFLTHLWRIAAERHDGPDAPPAHEALARGYETVTDHSAVSFRPGAEETLDGVRDRGHRVGLVTNGSRSVQQEKLDALSLHGRFETAVYAGEDTAPKPSAEPFDLALSRLDGRPERTVYVGNSLEHDVAGAHNAGLRAAWHPGPFDPTESDTHRPAYRLERLTDLFEHV